MAGITANGFEPKQYTEIISDLQTRSQRPEYFGAAVPVTPDSKIGILFGVIGVGLKDGWDLSGAVANQGNRDKAEGKYLDDLAGLNGLTRLGASGSAGTLLFTGANNTVAPQFTPVKSTSNQEIVLTNNVLTLNRNACNQSTFTLPSVVVGATYSITVNGSVYSRTVIIGQSAPMVAESLANAITAGGTGEYAASWSLTTGQIIVYSLASSNNISTSNSVGINFISVSSLVEASAATVGAIQFFANTLTTIVQPIIGITSITNPSDWSVGREEETDAELRQRMEDYEQSTGTATKPAIETTVSNIEGVSFAYVVENTGWAIDVDGRPPKSYEVYVSGGLDSQIANAVWETKPAGIELWGNVSVEVIDRNGDPQLVKFSRFDNKYAWVRVTYQINSEEEFLPDGEANIKAAVVETGSKFYRGEDLEPTKFYGNIYSKVSGVYISKIEVAITNNPSDPPTWSTTRLTVNNTTNLIFSTDRVPLLT